MSTSRLHALVRIATGIVAPLLLVGATLLPLWLFQQRLPDPLATHWGFDGRPDGAMRRQALILLVFAMSVLPGMGMALLAYRRDARHGEISAPFAVAAFIASVFAAMSWLTTSANLDAAQWQQAQRVTLFGVALPLLFAAVVATALGRCTRVLESPLVPATDAPRAGLSPGARAVWVGSARSSWALPLALGLLALGLFLSLAKPLSGLLLGATGLVGLLFTSIRVTADRHGVRIVYGSFGWPVQRVRLADIRQATALQVEPMAWGGWGYRGSLRMMGRAAVVLRAGSGLRLDLVGERTLVVTVDDANSAAGLINDLLAGPAHTDH